MRTDLLRELMPWPLGPFFLAYTAASLTHFVHNAEYLAFYPNMPTWITRQTVYQAWLGVAAVGALGIGLRGMGWPALGAVVLALYGALGLYGLGQLHPCPVHRAQPDRQPDDLVGGAHGADADGRCCARGLALSVGLDSGAGALAGVIR